MEFSAISWNLFHGRDFPPDPALFSWRSRLLGVEERGEAHVQVNRDLLSEFARVLSAAKWDLALLQECPPRFAGPLTRACEAEAHRVLTSRNSLGALRAFLARRNPDLIASGEGGSNLTLVRRFSRIVERREIAIHRGRPERRAMAMTRVEGTDGTALHIANLHATNDRPQLARADLMQAAEAATAWAGDAPLLFGGDLNLRPSPDAGAFEELRHRFGLTGGTAANAIDHLLFRNLDLTEPAAPWPTERRELTEGGLRLRLSDHAPVQASFKTGSR